MLVVKHKMMKNKEDVMFKMEKRKLEANGQVFEKFNPISQEEKGFSIFKDRAPVKLEKEKEEEKDIVLEENKEDQIDLEEDLAKEIENDEFAEYIKGEKEPKIFLTTMFKTVTRKSYLLLQGKLVYFINLRNQELITKELLLPKEIIYEFQGDDGRGD
jgi:hypothetical protein